VYREPGEYHVGDIYVRGIRGKHADPWGKEFGQRNTIWLIEVGGVVFVHLGDNGPLTEEIVDQLGQVDVLMTPLDGHDHILERSEVRAIRDVLQPSVVIPMHYRHPELEQPGGPKDLGELEPCLVDEPYVKRIAGNRVRLTREGLPEHETMFVFRPSPLVSPAPDAGSILHELCVNLRYLGQRRRDLRGERQQCAKLWKKGREAGWASEPTGVAEKVRALDWLRATAATPTPGKAARFELDIEEIARYALLALEVLPEEGAALRVRCGQLVRAVVRAQRVAWRVARNEAAYDDLGDGLADVVIESPAAGVESWSGEVRGRVAAGETVEVILLSGRPQETVACAEVENNTFIVQLAPDRGTWQGVAVLGKDGRGRVVSVSPVVWVRGRR